MLTQSVKANNTIKMYAVYTSKLLPTWIISHGKKMGKTKSGNASKKMALEVIIGGAVINRKIALAF